MSDGRIDPTGIPGADLDGEAIREVAAGLDGIVSEVTAATSSVRTSWVGLAEALMGPDLEVLHTGVDAPLGDLDSIVADFGCAATALDTFAGSVDDLKPRFDAVRADAQAFRDRTEGGVWLPVWRTTAADKYVGPAPWDDPIEYWADKGYTARSAGAELKVDWTESGDLVEENNDLVSRVNGLYAQLMEAEALCADAINRLLIGSCVVSTQTYTGEQIDAWMDQEGTQMPWGGRPYGDPNCVESVGLGLKDFGVGTVEGLGSLIGRDPTSGEWSWGTAGQAWLGLGTTLGSLALVAMPSTAILAMVPGSFGDVFRGAQSNVVDLGKGLIAYDMWGKDPVRAGSQTVANIATFFIPGAGQISGSVKTGLTALSASLKSSRLASFTASAAGIAGKVEQVLTLPSRLVDDALTSLTTRFKGVDFGDLNVGKAPDVDLDVPGTRGFDLDLDMPDSPRLDLDTPDSPRVDIDSDIPAVSHLDTDTPTDRHTTDVDSPHGDTTPVETDQPSASHSGAPSTTHLDDNPTAKPDVENPSAKPDTGMPVSHADDTPTATHTDSDGLAEHTDTTSRHGSDTGISHADDTNAHTDPGSGRPERIGDDQASDGTGLSPGKTHTTMRGFEIRSASVEELARLDELVAMADSPIIKVDGHYFLREPIEVLPFDADGYFARADIDPDSIYKDGVTWRQEYDRQLQLQQDGLNDLTIAEWGHNLTEFGKPAEEGGGRIGKTEQDAARVEAGGVTGDGTAILHGPDQVAGGRPNTYDGLGSSRINSSIGAQWKNDRITGLYRGIQSEISLAGLPMDSDLLRFVHMNVRLVS